MSYLLIWLTHFCYVKESRNEMHRGLPNGGKIRLIFFGTKSYEIWAFFTPFLKIRENFMFQMPILHHKKIGLNNIFEPPIRNFTPFL